MDRVDSLKLGVLLLGISALIVAAITLHAYYTGVIWGAQREKFYAYCSFNTVVVHANEELDDVKVLKPSGEVICSFSRVGRGSDEVCSVPSEGVYVVKVGEVKRAVTCGSPLGPSPARGD